MPMKPKEMIKFLLRNGFVEIIRGKGSHRKFFNQSTGRTTLVPYHSKELKKGMEHTILTQAGLKK
jgi:toxin-antitoxin system, toxin component, hicA family